MNMILEKTNEQYDLFFQKFERILSELYKHYTSLNESNRFEDASLLLEGFWNKVGNAIGSAVGSVKNAATAGLNALKKGGKFLYDLGSKIGEKAANAINSFLTGIKDLANKAANYLTSVPGKFVDFVVSITQKANQGWEDVKNKFAEIKDKAKEAWDDFIASVGEKVIEPVVNAYNKSCDFIVKNWEKVKASLESKKSQLQGWITNAQKSGNDNAKKVADWFYSTLDKATIVAADAGKILLGLVILPFYGIYKGGQGLIKLVDLAKEKIPQAWEEVKAGYEQGYQAKTNPPTGNLSESYVMSFDKFVKK